MNFMFCIASRCFWLQIIYCIFSCLFYPTFLWWMNIFKTGERQRMLWWKEASTTRYFSDAIFLKGQMLLFINFSPRSISSPEYQTVETFLRPNAVALSLRQTVTHFKRAIASIIHLQSEAICWLTCWGDSPR